MSGNRGVQVLAEKIGECDNVEQIADAANPVFDYRRFVDERIEITSIRGRQSDYRDSAYAVAGFRSADIDAGQIRVGGGAGRYLLAIEQYKLPVSLILRHHVSDQGNDYYKWERALWITQTSGS